MRSDREAVLGVDLLDGFPQVQSRADRRFEVHPEQVAEDFFVGPSLLNSRPVNTSIWYRRQARRASRWDHVEVFLDLVEAQGERVRRCSFPISRRGSVQWSVMQMQSNPRAP